MQHSGGGENGEEFIVETADDEYHGPNFEQVDPLPKDYIVAPIRTETTKKYVVLCFSVLIGLLWTNYCRTGQDYQEAGQDYSDDYGGLNSYKTQIIVPKTYSGQEVCKDGIFQINLFP